jgi:hypothetical protein
MIIKDQELVIKAAEEKVRSIKAAIKEIENAASAAYIVWREESAAKKAKTA